jgi:hypothetical protein
MTSSKIEKLKLTILFTTLKSLNNFKRNINKKEIKLNNYSSRKQMQQRKQIVSNKNEAKLNLKSQNYNHNKKQWLKLKISKAPI